MTKPTIHLNGTSGEALLEGYRTAMEAVGEAVRKLNNETHPNARDYYPQGNHAYQDAVKEHTERRVKLESVYNELMELAEHCDSIVTEIAQRRAERNRV